MATSKRGIRSTRKLRDWTVEQVESGKFPGLVWDDPLAKTMFRIPWKHAGKHEFRQDEDAGFFKAWAIYKGKYSPGENNPATWKTRIRCALSKSPEFEEVPSRSRLDGTEPYKVYRLVPIQEQGLGKKAKPRKTKQARTGDASSPEVSASPTEAIQLPADSLLLLQTAETPAPEAVVSLASSAFNPPTYQGGEVSPQAAEPEDYFLCLSITYAGEVICKYLLPEGEFLITSAPVPQNGPVNCMKRVILPAPDKVADSPKREVVQSLLRDLAKGIMVASNHEGIFIRCRGNVCISWSGFLAPEDQSKLENNTYQQLFQPRKFQAALEQHRQGLAPLPDHRIVLYVGDEMEENRSMDCKPIVIQMEQAFTIRLLSSSCSQ
ncbi:interferon regulatory factor 9 isoform 2-T3 [Vipera latastei]